VFYLFYFSQVGLREVHSKEYISLRQVRKANDHKKSCVPVCCTSHILRYKYLSKRMQAHARVEAERLQLDELDEDKNRGQIATCNKTIDE